MTKSYILQGPDYLRYDVEGDKVDAGYPRPIAAGWTGLDAVFTDGAGCALDLGDGRLYFFDGDGYQRIDQSSNAADAPRRSIAEGWPGMADAGFGDELDAAVNLGDGTAVFFRGDECVVFDITGDHVVAEYPRPIADEWPGLAERGFAGGLSAAVRWPDGRIFFFKGGEYVRYDRQTNTVTAEPRSIAEGWPGLTDAPIDAIWVKSVAAGGGGAVPVDPTPAGKLGPGDHVWYWNGLVSTEKNIPRHAWFGHMDGFDPHVDTDYRGHGGEIYNFVVHDDGVILRGQPHMKSGAGTYGWLNRNPGNLTGLPGGHDFGQYRDKFNWHNFMIFPTMEAGRAAIIPFILQWGPMTISAAMHKYAPRRTATIRCSTPPKSLRGRASRSTRSRPHSPRSNSRALRRRSIVGRECARGRRCRSSPRSFPTPSARCSRSRAPCRLMPSTGSSCIRRGSDPIAALHCSPR